MKQRNNLSFKFCLLSVGLVTGYDSAHWFYLTLRKTFFKAISTWLPYGH
jgi:hypothetical protein